MNLEKAIEILTIASKGEFNLDADDAKAAFKLGIQALKEIKALRLLHALDMTTRLPGETDSIY